MRTETTTRELFTFDELSDKAKETAISRNREWNTEHNEWWDGTVRDFVNIAKLMGIETDCSLIQFSGFSSQGDGASFTGQWECAPGGGAAVRDYAPADTDLHEIADTLAGFAGVRGQLVRRNSNYSHANTVDVDCTDAETGYPVADEVEREVTHGLRGLMDWLYRTLEKESEYLESDEQVAESLHANNCEFTADGTDA